MLNDYLKTYPKKNGHLFALGEDGVNDLLKRLAEKAKITLTGRVRWHCLRKYGVTVLHGQTEEPVMKYMVGKHIGKDLRVYIQKNRETFKAFKRIEPQISLTNTNGSNGNGKLAKNMEELKKSMFKQKVLTMILEKSLSPEQKKEIIESVSKELGVAFSAVGKKPITLEEAITELAECLQEEEQEAINELANGDNNEET